MWTKNEKPETDRLKLQAQKAGLVCLKEQK